MGLAVLCPGQGAQHPEMFSRFETEPGLGEILDQVSRHVGTDVRRLDTDPLHTRIYENAVAQPLLCGYALAAWRALASRLQQPVIFAGYSVGEIAAYACSGMLDAASALELIATRARLMDASAREPHGMLALVGAPETVVQSICEQEGLEIAIMNGPTHYILGGTEPRIEAGFVAAEKRGVPHIRKLNVQIASHTSLLGGAAEAFEAALVQAPLQRPTVPVLAGIDAAVIREPGRAISSLSAQICRTIQWYDCMGAALEMGASVFLELGPGRSLTKLLNETYPDVAARALDDFRTLDGAATWVDRQLQRAAWGPV